MDDEENNEITLSAYEKGLKEYNDAAIMNVSGSVKDWIDAGLALLTPNAHILEIGSAHGRDARYIESKGFRVERSDAANSFVNFLQQSGYEARLLNVLKDDLGGPYDMVFANAVLLHFNPEQAERVIRKVKDALVDGGLIVFSVKAGTGSGWSDKKLNDPRFFHYWQERPLRELLDGVGFSVVYFRHAKSGHDNNKWFHVIARK